jgi:hypothetical protein
VPIRKNQIEVDKQFVKDVTQKEGREERLLEKLRRGLEKTEEGW